MVDVSLEVIVKALNGQWVGPCKGFADCVVRGLRPLASAQDQHIAFFSNSKYLNDLKKTKALAVIIEKAWVDDCPVPAIVVNNAYLGFAKAAALFDEVYDQPPGMHPLAVCDDSAQIDETASIGPNCVISEHVRIGKSVQIGAGCVVGRGVHIQAGTCLKANVTLYPQVKLGRGCLIHSGAVIGSDGFGIANDQGKWVKVPQLGSVVIEDEVEIGANTTIDRGALEDTTIASFVKIDNQVQIAHNVSIGTGTAIAANVGVAGSTQIGAGCLIGGAASIGGHLQLADGVCVAGASSVTKSIVKPGIYSSVFSAKPHQVWLKRHAIFNRLELLMNKVKKMERSLKKQGKQDD